MSASKRTRPPNINLSLARQKRGPPIEIEAESPVVKLQDDDEDEDFQETLQLSSGESSPVTPPSIPSLKLDTTDEESSSDDLSKDLAELAQLRASVKQNLRLRPIRSSSNLPKVDINGATKSPLPQTGKTPKDADIFNIASPTSTTSAYFTPISDSLSLTATLPPPLPPAPKSNPRSDPLATPIPGPIEPASLYSRLTSPRRPLLIDTRPPTTHVSIHIQHSINIAIPSLILKRCRKPGAGFQALDALRQFITTDESKQEWSDLLAPEGPWDGNVVVYDDEMDPKDKDNVGVTAWALLPVLRPLLTRGSVDYLKGGFAAARHDSKLGTLIISGGEFNYGFNADSPPPQAGGGGLKKGGGLFQLDTFSAALPPTKQPPELEPPVNPGKAHPQTSRPSFAPFATNNHSLDMNNNQNLDVTRIVDSTPSPPPSHMVFPHRSPGSSFRKMSVPTLRKLDTRSTEKLSVNIPSLSIRTRPLRSATLAVPPSFGPPASPGHLNLTHSNHSPPLSARFTPSSPSNDMANYLTPYYTPPHTPGTPKPPLPFSEPQTARPDLDPPTTEEAFPSFTISTILPNFLYLGPELTEPAHVEELQSMGVKRILNIAYECDDDQGLNLKEVFEKYYKIPMRDIVEEENITRGVREACEILDDARLHSSPVYVHCKAGKSRSVTAVMAYLIHANHWTLSRAYSFVLERRKGISPNIGFVSELMSFEEQELGGKSIGVHPSAPAGTSQHEHPMQQQQDNYTAAIAGGSHLRRAANVRDSMPPNLIGGMGGGMMDSPEDGNTGGGSISAGGILQARVNGDSGQEMEIKDRDGRYRHARRAPVNETTLQPMRRVSKAGLESSFYS